VFVCFLENSSFTVLVYCVFHISNKLSYADSCIYKFIIFYYFIRPNVKVTTISNNIYTQFKEINDIRYIGLVIFYKSINIQVGSTLPPRSTLGNFPYFILYFMILDHHARNKQTVIHIANFSDPCMLLAFIYFKYEKNKI
jgi:hypothetical protein